LFASCYIIVTYFSIKFYRKQSATNVILAAVSLSIALNTRIVAFFAAFILFVIFGVKMYKERSRKELKWLAMYSAISFCVFIIITPGYWSVNPFARLIEALSLFSQYPYPYLVYFMGNYYASSELPWYYIPVWMMATVPVLYIILFIGGISCKIAGFRKSGGNETDMFMMLSFFLPLLYVVIFKPTLYNGWRHMYFIFPPFVYFSIYGLNKIYYYLANKQKPILKYIMISVAVAALANSVVWIVTNHPYQYVYFNEIGRIFAAGNFEKDYWQVSGKQALEYILSIEQYDIALARKSYSSLLILDRENRKRFIDAYYEVPDIYAGRLGVGGSGVYNVFGGDYYIHYYIGDEIFTLPGYENIKDFIVDGLKIASVLKRDFSYDLISGRDVVKNIWSNFNADDARNMIDNDINSSWTTLETGQVEFWEQRSSQTEDIQIIIEFTDESDYNLIRLYCTQNFSPRIFTADATFYTSADGENWKEAVLIWKNEEDYIIFDENYKYLMIVFSQEIASIQKISEILFGLIDTQYLY
jgi:hypothetical protein